MKLALSLLIMVSFIQKTFAQTDPVADASKPVDTSKKVLDKANANEETNLLKKPDTIYSYSAKSIDGQLVNLADYKNHVLMIVNVASKCGYTPQYKDLETLYRKYKDKGFVILGFPSNDFGSQEPGSNEEIKKFCKTNYDVTFPLFEKLSVKGQSKQPVYKFLTEQSGSDFTGEIAWNFVKFIIAKNGKVAGRFGSSTKPLDEKVTSKIEEQLK